MPYYHKSDTSIYYEVRGSGEPLLLLPPGGMNATIDFWGRTPFNAVEIFAEHFRVIALDQRNAGRSSGPISDGNPWDSYLEDHVGLLNHLGLARCHLMGCCIGANHALNMLRVAGSRIGAAVLQQPAGLTSENETLWPPMAQAWADGLVAARPELEAQSVEDFWRRMWRGQTFLTVSREDVRAIDNPVLVLPGIDAYHPNAVGREIATLIPGAETFEPWREPAELAPGAVHAIRDFLRRSPI